MPSRPYPTPAPDLSSLTGPRALQPGETAPQCAIHQRPYICPSCAGAVGGRHKSPLKTRKARRNGKKGGRPPAKRTRRKSA